MRGLRRPYERERAYEGRRARKAIRDALSSEGSTFSTFSTRSKIFVPRRSLARRRGCRSRPDPISVPTFVPLRSSGERRNVREATSLKFHIPRSKRVRSWRSPRRYYAYVDDGARHYFIFVYIIVRTIGREGGRRLSSSSSPPAVDAFARIAASSSNI